MTKIFMVEMETIRNAEGNMDHVPVIREFEARETPHQYKYVSQWGNTFILRKSDARVSLTREEAIEKLINRCERNVQRAWDHWSDAQDKLVQARKLRDRG